MLALVFESGNGTTTDGGKEGCLTGLDGVGFATTTTEDEGF